MILDDETQSGVSCSNHLHASRRSEASLEDAQPSVRRPQRLLGNSRSRTSPAPSILGQRFCSGAKSDAGSGAHTPNSPRTSARIRRRHPRSSGPGQPHRDNGGGPEPVFPLVRAHFSVPSARGDRPALPPYRGGAFASNCERARTSVSAGQSPFSWYPRPDSNRRYRLGRAAPVRRIRAGERRFRHLRATSPAPPAGCIGGAGGLGDLGVESGCNALEVVGPRLEEPRGTGMRAGLAGRSVIDHPLRRAAAREFSREGRPPGRRVVGRLIKSKCFQAWDPTGSHA